MNEYVLCTFLFNVVKSLYNSFRNPTDSDQSTRKYGNLTV